MRWTGFGQTTQHTADELSSGNHGRLGTMSVDYHKVILKALAQIRRTQVLATKYNPQTEALFSHAFAYAIMHSVYPLHDEDPGFTTEREAILDIFPYYETYVVSREQVNEVAELLDEKWRAEERITFYDLEEPYKYGGKSWSGNDARMDLIHTCRYFYLRGMFDDEFWQGFMSDCPTEAHGIIDEWDRSAISDWM
jgi:hypothetical protein